MDGASVVSKNSNHQTRVWYHFVTNAHSEPDSYLWDWNGATANPTGGITAWRGVSTASPFDDVTPATNTDSTGSAIAPSITPNTANAQLVSVFGAGLGPDGAQAFALPVGGGVGDEAGALKVNVPKGGGTYFAHLVGDAPQPDTNATLAQSVHLDFSADWTAISLALRPK